MPQQLELRIGSKDPRKRVPCPVRRAIVHQNELEAVAPLHALAQHPERIGQIRKRRLFVETGDHDADRFAARRAFAGRCHRRQRGFGQRGRHGKAKKCFDACEPVPLQELRDDSGHPLGIPVVPNPRQEGSGRDPGLIRIQIPDPEVH